MPRRETTNRTNIARISGVPVHHALAFFVCVRCSSPNWVDVGTTTLTPTDAFETAAWECAACGFVHSKDSELPSLDHHGAELPFAAWAPVLTRAGSLAAERFWKSFFTIATEAKDAYWKQCNTCGRRLPARAFSGHAGWGPLEKQMECRSCKAVINTNLNPKRTKEQLHESAMKRRTADLLLKGENQRIDIQALFERFGSRCFKTGKPLNIKDRSSWRIDHTLPSRWLYPLSEHNATLLSTEANSNKRDSWPSEFYTNDQLKQLARILKTDLALLASKEPVINTNIDVDAAVTRMLTVRGATDMTKRIQELKKLLEDYDLVDQLSDENKHVLGYD